MSAKTTDLEFSRREEHFCGEKKWILISFTSENPKSQKAIFLQKSTGSIFLSNTVSMIINHIQLDDIKCYRIYRRFRSNLPSTMNFILYSYNSKDIEYTTPKSLKIFITVYEISSVYNFETLSITDDQFHHAIPSVRGLDSSCSITDQSINMHA